MSHTGKNITLKIEGMDCNNCALGISKKIEKKGLQNINVNFALGEATFTLPNNNVSVGDIIRDIESLGYKAFQGNSTEITEHTISALEIRFAVSLILTLPLLFHMFLSNSFLGNPFFQIALATPVLFIGIMQFGKSAFGSIKALLPNMDVLILTGAIAAYGYSISGIILHYNSEHIHHYLFFETSSSILTLVMLGNIMEHRSVKKTTSALRELSSFQKVNAKKVITDNASEKITEISTEYIEIGDVLQVNTGDRIPIDGKVISGNCSVDESMITGESIPVSKNPNSNLIGGTIILNGNIRMHAEKKSSDTLLSKIIELVKKAQSEKPSIQKLGDKISAVFVPAVFIIAIITFTATYFIAEKSLQSAIMNSIAVLVISCPCAMGLATPTAVMVAVGKAAKNGIIIKTGNTLEQLSKIKYLVLDKTGTLTTGNFKIKKISTYSVSEKEIINILYKAEQHSSHPIAISIVHELKSKADANYSFKEVVEIKGKGLVCIDLNGDKYEIGSYALAAHLNPNPNHTVYILKNNILIATLDIEDELKENIHSTITELKKEGITPVLLSGDRESKCKDVAEKLNIETYYSEQLPGEKLKIIEKYNSRGITAMLGDGINDGPALSLANIGISLGSATQTAIESSDVILMSKTNLDQLIKAIHLSKQTLTTIKQNLFWAFFYNVLAIPVAAFGYLSPIIGTATMALSDVIVIGNSIRLKFKK